MLIKQKDLRFKRCPVFERRTEDNMEILKELISYRYFNKYFLRLGMETSVSTSNLRMRTTLRYAIKITSTEILHSNVALPAVIQLVHKLWLKCLKKISWRVDKQGVHSWDSRGALVPSYMSTLVRRVIVICD